MPRTRTKLFCEISPTCYAISTQKEVCKRHLKNLFSKERFAKQICAEPLPVVVSSHHSNMIKRAKGVNLTHQKNKANNIMLACSKINGIIIHPGETFSFWATIGKPSEKKGYTDGRVLRQNKLVAGPGGGICNLANTINLLILHSPLDITEFHKHSDALAPDEGARVPLSAGTSVCYNSLDYRFKNKTTQNFQLLTWCEGEVLHAELRSEAEISFRYLLVEENHHFKKEGDKFFRNSKIYRNVMDKASERILEKELIWDNHSEVMYDYNLIPKDQIIE